jgi:hypothetical protein
MGATTQNQRHDTVGRKSLAKHAGRKFLTNPDASGIIGNNREGELAIGNYRELSGIIGTRFLPIFPNNSQSGKIGSDRECRISVSGIAIILQVFSQMPDSRFFAECPRTIPKSHGDNVLRGQAARKFRLIFSLFG